MVFEQPASTPTEDAEDQERQCDDAVAASMFRKLMRKFDLVRNVSSPVLKLITIHRVMNEFMAALDGSSNSGPHEADNLIVVIFYILVSLTSE